MPRWGVAGALPTAAGALGRLCWRKLGAACQMWLFLLEHPPCSTPPWSPGGRRAPSSPLGSHLLPSQQSNHKRKKTEFIPYRDSVLTWLLKENLGECLDGGQEGEWGDTAPVLLNPAEPAPAMESGCCRLGWGRASRGLVSSTFLRQERASALVPPSLTGKTQHLKITILRLLQLVGLVPAQGAVLLHGSASSRGIADVSMHQPLPGGASGGTAGKCWGFTSSSAEAGNGGLEVQSRCWPCGGGEGAPHTFFIHNPPLDFVLAALPE